MEKSPVPHRCGGLILKRAMYELEEEDLNLPLTKEEVLELKRFLWRVEKGSETEE